MNGITVSLLGNDRIEGLKGCFGEERSSPEKMQAGEYPGSQSGSAGLLHSATDSNVMPRSKRGGTRGGIGGHDASGSRENGTEPHGTWQKRFDKRASPGRP